MRTARYQNVDSGTPRALLDRCADRRSMKSSRMALVAAGCGMKDAAVVPKHEHVGLPGMPIDEPFLTLPVVEFLEEWHRFGRLHVFYTDDISDAAEDAEASSLGMLAQDGMAEFGERFF